MHPYTNPEVEKANDLLHQANVIIQKTWLTQMVFTWRWWLLVTSAALAWVVWIKFRDKKSTDSLLYAGFFIMLATSFLDTIGMSLGLWSYSVKSVPLIPPFVTFDLCQIPIANMLWIQIMPKLNPVIKSLILATVASFISQPVAVLVGTYNPKVWRHFYSFPIVAVLYLIAYSLYKRFQAEEGAK